MAPTPLSPLDKLLAEQPQAQPRERGVYPSQSDSRAMQVTPSKAGEIPAELVPVIADTAKRYNVPANILAGIASKESNFNPDAIGAPTQYGRARGIMQYLDGTAQGVGIDSRDPAQSIDAAGRQIRERLDKGASMVDAVREHFAGPDRKLWGAKTDAYGTDVLDRAQTYIDDFRSGESTSPEDAPEGGYTAEYAQDLMSRLNADEPGRYSIATPEQVAEFEARQRAGNSADFDVNDPAFKDKPKAAPDGALSAIGKSLRNIPGNFQEALAGQLRSFGEGIDDQTLVTDAAEQGVIDRMREQGIITMQPGPGFLETPVPTMPDGKVADTARIAQYIRENAQALGYTNDPALNNGITQLGQELGDDARKDRLEINPDGPLAKYSSMIIGSTAEMVPALVAAAVTKSPGVAMGMIGGQVYGQGYERARENKEVPQNPSEAASYAMSQAVAEAIPSALPVHAILAPGANFFKGLLKAGAAEAIQESVTGAIQAGVDKGTIDPNMTWEEARQQIVDSAIAGAGAGMALRGGTVGLRRAREALRSPEGDLGAALNESVDNTDLPGSAEQDAVNNLDPNSYAREPAVNPETGEIIEPDPTPQPANETVLPPEPVAPAPTGPLGRADALIDRAAVELPAETAFAGQPGQQVDVRIPGIEPFRATVDSYVDGEVMLVDESGDRFQLTREEMADAVPVEAEPPLLTDVVEPGVDVQIQHDDAPGDIPVLNDVVTPEGEAETSPPTIERPAAEPAVPETEAELRDALKYVTRQARGSGGWTKPLIAERDRIQQTLAAVSEPAQSATDAQESASEPGKTASDATETASAAEETASTAKPRTAAKPTSEPVTREQLAGLSDQQLADDLMDWYKRIGRWDNQREGGSMPAQYYADRREHMAEVARRRSAGDIAKDKRAVARRLRDAPDAPVQTARYDGDLYAVPMHKDLSNGVKLTLTAEEKAIDDRFLANAESVRDAEARGERAELDAGLVSEWEAMTKEAARRATAKGEPEPPKTTPTEPGDAAVDNAVKWFGSKDKADAWIAKKGLGDSHQVVKKGLRFEIQPKQAAPEPAAEPAAEAPKPERQKNESAHAYRARLQLGTDVGGTVTPNVDIGYAKAGDTYTVTKIGSDGTVYVERPQGRGTWSRAELQRARNQGAEFNPTEPPAKPVKGKKAEPAKAEPTPQVGGVDAIRGEPIDKEWTAFNAASGTRYVPRTEMPQVRAEHRGALVNFLNARGIAHTEVEIPASQLKATQAEYSPERVQRAKEYDGGQRAILISSDNHVVDGHHQWLAELDMGGNVRAIRLDAPIEQVLEQVRDFPSSTMDKGATETAASPATEADFGSEAYWQRLADEQAADGNNPQEKPAARPDVQISENKVFTEDAAAKARALLKSKLGQLNSGIDPEIMQAGITLAGYHIEKGARTFAAYAKAMTADLGDMVRPYLKSWYLGAKFDPRAAEFDGLSTAAEVEGFDVNTITTEEPNRAPSPAERVERNRPQPEASQSVDANPVQDAGRADAGRPGEPGADAGRQRRTGQRDNRVPDDGAAAGREPGNQRVHQRDGEYRPSQRAAGGAERAGSGSDSRPGNRTDRKRAKQIARHAPAAGTGEFAQRVKAQKAAGKAKTTWGDPTSIDKALPLLLPEQRSDVLKAEIRYANANGILYTNGTGTGKTGTGLGIAKRFYNDGKENIVVVVPTDKIASDWVKFAELMGMPLKKLDGIADNGGSGPVITTYANFGQNNSLAKRSWDAVIPDESHYLSSNEAGDSTAALEQLRALTGHHAGMDKWMRGRYSGAYELRDQAFLDVAQAKADNKPAAEIARLEQHLQDTNATIERLRKRVEPRWQERWAKQDNIGRVAFLSATPFAYHKNIQYAEGFLFDFVPPEQRYGNERSRGYNVGDAYQQFMMQHFGYRMRYDKLTAPEAGVQSQVMERQFNNWLKDQGALSGRRLEVPFDYDRKFITVDDAIGTKIDEALRFLREGEDGKFRKVYDGVMSSFDHQSRMYLLEALKARAAIPIIRSHLDAGRKVVVFHDFNKGGAENPFVAALRNIRDPEVAPLARDVLNRDMFKFDMQGLASPIATLTQAFPEALLFNGTVSKAKRRANADTFNSDDTEPTLFVAQSDAAREGVSLHDTSGKYPRVEINLGMPTRPVAATQIEGRIYRTGQASDAMFRYLTTGTGWEASAFASKIAERASTAENMALGNESRDLRRAFIDAYNAAEEHAITPNDGKGGKASDGELVNLSPYDQAKSFYWANQKNSKRRDQREGTDYFATAEPVGLKKVQWADIKPGESVLEPSAGHGAIARFFPDTADVTMIEPSYDLSQRAALANGDAKVINDTFESHHIANKYNAIVMNPPFGSGGKTAIEHLTKAARHLSEGGRIVVTLPRGGMADRRLDAFFADPAHSNLHTVADIEMPGVAFERAGTNVASRILVLEKHAGDDVPIQSRKIDLSSIDSTAELFDRLENLDLPERLPLQEKATARASLLDGSGTNGNRYDAATLNQTLREGPLGDTLAPLLDSGRLVVHDTAPGGIHPLTQGWTDSEGNIHLVAGQLNADTAMPVLMHEAFHTGADGLLGSPRWGNLMSRLNGFSKAAESGRMQGEWADAYRRVRAAQDAGDSMSPVRAVEELGAYAVEHFEQAPPGVKKWVESLLGTLKEWLVRRFGLQFGDVTPAQLRALAVAALRSERRAPATVEPDAETVAAKPSGWIDEQMESGAFSWMDSAMKADPEVRDYIERMERVYSAEKESDPDDWTAQEKAAYRDGDWRKFSKLRGYSDAEIADYAKFLDQSEALDKKYDDEFTAYISHKMVELMDSQADNRYSLMDKVPSAKAVDSWFTRKLTDAMAGPRSSGQYSLLALAPMDRMVEELTDHTPSAKKYLAAKRGMDAYRNEKHRMFDDIAQEWLKLNVNPKYRKAAEDMAVLMHDATIAQVDPAEPLRARLTPEERDILQNDPNSQRAQDIEAELARLQPIHDELSARWNALPERLQSQYRRVREAYKAMTAELDQIIADNLAAAVDLSARRAERQYNKEIEEINDDGLTGQDRQDAIDKATKKYQTAVTKSKMNKKARLTMLRQKFEANRLRGPYFPLARFGDYFVTVRDGNGKVLTFSRFENKADQERFAKRQAGKGKVETGLLSNSQALKGAVDSRFVADIEEILGKADINDSVRDQVWQRYLESMPDMSLRKGFIHRKNREGYTQDATRAFAHKMFHGAHQMGRLKFGNQLQESLDEAEIEARHSKTPERDTAVINELARRHDYVMNPKGGAAAQALTSAAFIYQLSMSPAAAAVNLAQTVMVGVPVIGAQYGMAKTAVELTRASKDFAMGRGQAARSQSLTADERSAMQEAYRSGLIESTQSHNLAGVGDGVGVRYSAVRNKVMGVIAWAFHQTERTNREVTYLASYRLAREAGETHEQAMDSATSLTYKTHFDYGNTNRPRLMHGDTAKVMLVFRNYQVNMLWRLFRDTHQALRGDKEGRAEAVKQLAGMTGMMALNAGVKGVWMYSIAMIIASMLFGDDAEEQFKKGTIEALGPTAAGLLLNGIPGHLTGTALSERIGMPDLWFRSPDRQMEGKEEFQYWQSQLLGFLPSIAQNLFTGYHQAADGNVARGIETAAPKAVKDLLRAYRYGSEGATTLAGDQVVSKFTPGEIFAQAMGFTPAVLAEQYDRNSALKNAEQRIMDTRSKLLSKMAVAQRTKDTELREETMAAIRDFNRDNKRVAITPANIQGSIRSRNTRSNRTDNGLYLNPKLNKQLRDNIGPAIYQ